MHVDSEKKTDKGRFRLKAFSGRDISDPDPELYKKNPDPTVKKKRYRIRYSSEKNGSGYDNINKKRQSFGLPLFEALI